MAMKSLGLAIVIVGLPSLAAVLMVCAFPPHNQGWIAWVALVPVTAI